MKLNWNKLRDGVTEAAANLGTQAKQTLDATRAEIEEVDWDKVGADLQNAGVQAKDLTESALRRTRSFVDEARQAWKAHGAADAAFAADALEQVAAAPDTAEAQGILRNMPPEDMQAGLQTLAGRWEAQLGPEGAREQLEKLDAVLEATQQVGADHNRRARSVPRHQGRPASIEAGLLDAVGALRRSLDALTAQIDARPWPDVYAVTSGASEGLWSAGEKVAKQAKAWVGEGGEVGAAVGRARAGLGEAIDSASPEWLKARYTAAKDAIGDATRQAETVLNGLDGLEAEVQDRDAMFARFETVLGHAKNLTDPEADAIGVGFLKEAAGVATGGRGKELVYVRETGQLRVVDLQMGGARLAVGASKRPFARSVYGGAEGILGTSRRDIGEVGAMIFHVGSGSSAVEDEAHGPVRSWHGTLGVGFNASLPLVGDQSIYSVKERTLAVHSLTAEQRSRIEALLDEVPEGSRKWTSIIQDATNPS